MLSALGSIAQPSLGLLSAALSPLKPALLPVQLPTGTPAHASTPDAEIDAGIERLRSKRKEWANLRCDERARLLRLCLAGAIEAAEGAVRLMVKAKGSYGSGSGEERALLCAIVAALREYAETLEADGHPTPRKLKTRPNGQIVAEVFPTGLEGVFFGGYKGEVWIAPGKDASTGRLYRDLESGEVAEGRLALVLGAGNQISVVILDILHMLVSQNSVVACKLNPVNDYLGPFTEEVLAPLIERGYVQLVFGGPEQGKYLCHHPLVDHIHLTGSKTTFDKIVWGDKPKVGKPPLEKEVTAELGCVTPYIITPGDWSEAALQYYADECAGGLINSAGHNCTKLELLVTSQDWPQRQAFIAAVRACLAKLPRRVAWYPGSEQKHRAFKAKFPDAEELGTVVENAVDPPPNYLPWLFKSDLSPEEADTQTENWCGVLQEVALPHGPDPGQFLEAAVDFVNNRCWGSLSCSLIAPPATDAQALDKAVQDLRYGSVCVNLPSFVGYTFPKLSWGAYPGNSPEDVGSGIGIVHNTLLFDHVEKSVVYSPWIHYPTHLWSPNVRNLDASTKAALRFLAKPNLLTLNSTAFAALRG